MSLVVAAVMWLICFAACLFLEQRKLFAVRRSQGVTMATLFVLSALMTAPVLLGHIAMDHLFLRVAETKKL